MGIGIVNARELIDSPTALPGVRSVSTETPGIGTSAVVNGVEIAWAERAEERSGPRVVAAESRGVARPRSYWSRTARTMVAQWSRSAQ